MFDHVIRRVATTAALSLLVVGGAASGAAARPSSSDPSSAPSTSAIPAGSFPSSPSWHFTRTATTSTLDVVRVVSRSTVWAVGGGGSAANGDGTVVRTVDGGRHWRDVTPPNGASQVFRDVEAFDRDHALVLAVGPGEASRIYRTADGGTTWTAAFVNPDPRAFYDCMAFFDRRHGLAMSDPVDGKFRILATRDGGRTWRLRPTSGMPPALTEEYGVSSGTCLVANRGQNAWFGSTVTGADARVFHTADRGRSWTVSTTPIPGTPQGIVSLSFLPGRHGLAVGGDPPPQFGGDDVGYVARTVDAGSHWSLVGAPAGYRNGVAWVPGVRGAAVAVGPTGSDLSTDSGRSWRSFPTPPLFGVDCRARLCWAVGPDGVAGKLRW